MCCFVLAVHGILSQKDWQIFKIWILLWFSCSLLCDSNISFLGYRPSSGNAIDMDCIISNNKYFLCNTDICCHVHIWRYFYGHWHQFLVKLLKAYHSIKVDVCVTATFLGHRPCTWIILIWFVKCVLLRMCAAQQIIKLGLLLQEQPLRGPQYCDDRVVAIPTDKFDQNMLYASWFSHGVQGNICDRFVRIGYIMKHHHLKPMSQLWQERRHLYGMNFIVR